MSKKKKMTKTLMAATVAASVMAVSNPASAATYASAEKAVVKAEKLAGALKWEVSIEYRKTKYPNNLVGYPNMKMHNEVKALLADARKQVAGLKGKEKEVLSARLDANVATYLNRSVAYIDAVSSGLKIQKKYNELKAKAAKGEVDDQTEKLYHEVSWEIKKNAFMLDRVYGVTTREEFRDFYKHSAENQLKDLLYPISIKMQIDRAEKALKDNKPELAAGYLGNVEFLIKEAAKNGLKESNPLIKSSLSDLEKTEKEFSKHGTLYVADSKDADKPSVFGPASGSESSKSIYLYAGENEHIKLQNVSINGNLTVLGSPKGAGTVHLENVKVNKVNNSGGAIIVEDIAEHSLYMKGVEADSLVINDANGSNLVADTGVKVKNLVVSEKAGAKGKVNLESKESGSFETVTIAAKGGEDSEGIALKGNFSETAIEVTGENAVLAIGEGTEVKEISIKAASQISVAKGAVVKEVKKDSSVKGEVEIDNKGTVEKADEGIEVGGNKPGEVTKPGEGTVTPPAAGGGNSGGGSTDPGTNPVTPAVGIGITDIDAEGLIDIINNDANQIKVDLSSLGANTIFKGITVDKRIKLTSLKAEALGTTNLLAADKIIESEFSIVNEFNYIPNVADGVSLGSMRSYLGGNIVIEGTPVNLAGSAIGSPITVTIDLGDAIESNTRNFSFGTVVKSGNIITVNVKPEAENTKIRDITELTAATQVDFLKLLFFFNGAALTNEEQVTLTQQILAVTGTSTQDLGEVTLESLTGKSFNANGYEIVFNS
ncbi:MAG: hypothetical protein ACQEW2_12070 [Bacillota bacterium]|uniref:hypothetical protein n=1 Tax=Cytobacillus firmus TaxID=1399 RepID=UPI00077C2D50|nr:hypothetical protein [Cytobacillus firmus]MEC1894299.1 hypothetical protein [Cytobacillus firmus]MED4448766.1 hypothetical protein [Cytobacillus firmus]MED4768418.1 hypothetical protein [Cytobacillus firmus]SUV10529.1 Uncharacterised protein [Cytobacillus firmus]